MNFLYQVAQLFNSNDVDLPRVAANESQLQVVLQIVFGLAGAIAALVITIAGLQYVISQGDSQKIAKAKNTIIFALMGLVLAIASFSIVRWVIGRTV